MEKNYKYILATEDDRRFNKFLDMTIRGSAYNYFNENKDLMEMEEYKDDNVGNNYVELCLFNEMNNKALAIALESLTENERLVISFSFEEEMSGEEIAQRVNININSVYRMRKRVLKKLKKLILEVQNNEKNKLM